MSKKVLYLIHVDWESIKQRPQFIAEGLSKYYEVHVFFPVSFLTKFKRLIKNKKYSNLSINPILSLPFNTKIWPIHKLNETLWKLYFKFIIKKYNSEYIWITYPTLYGYIPSDTKSKIIYDCMDDVLSFEHVPSKDKLLISEKKLISKSSVIFVSANSLADKLDKREKCKDKIVLNRNAFDGKIFDLETNYLTDQKKTYKIGYVGSISYWFDFESLYYTLKKHKNIEYHLIGPMECISKIKTHERMKLYGPVNHKDLYSYTQNFDCLIMPFKLNELIASVDPVKLNEYINYNKPIISIYYDEIKRFSPFVSFYHTKEDLDMLLDNLIKQNFTKKYSNKQRIEFLRSNTWNERVKNIRKALNDT